jgi:phosphoglycerate dehydrogenase-like enzyme
MLANWHGNGHGLNLQTLHGKTLGIIGLGNIGSKVAKIATSLGMKIIYCDPYINVDEISAFKKSELDELLRNSDFISLHVHKKDVHFPLIDAYEISQMKFGVNIINTSRAELINLRALKDGLENGSIRYYASDVFVNEPTQISDLELTMKNTTFTPHIAGSNLDAYQLALDNCMENMQRALSGDQIQWLVKL